MHEGWTDLVGVINVILGASPTPRPHGRTLRMAVRKEVEKGEEERGSQAWTEEQQRTKPAEGGSAAPSLVLVKCKHQCVNKPVLLNIWQQVFLSQRCFVSFAGAGYFRSG